MRARPADFFGDRSAGDGGAGGAGGGRSPARTRDVERVDVTEFFSDATRQLLQRAAQTALEWGSLDLDTDHLLYAALQDDVVRHVLGELEPGDRVLVDADGDELTFEDEKGGAADLVEAEQREEAAATH